MCFCHWHCYLNFKTHRSLFSSCCTFIWISLIFFAVLRSLNFSHTVYLTDVYVRVCVSVIEVLSSFVLHEKIKSEIVTREYALKGPNILVLLLHRFYFTYSKCKNICSSLNLCGNKMHPFFLPCILIQSFETMKIPHFAKGLFWQLSEYNNN